MCIKGFVIMTQITDNNQVIAYIVLSVTACYSVLPGLARSRDALGCCAESATARVAAVPLRSGRSTPPPLKEAPPRADE